MTINLTNLIGTDEYGKYYYNENGQLHRLDGPAAEYVNGKKVWYQNGQPHRLDGPAVEYKYNDSLSLKCWYINGVRYSEKEFSAWQSHFWNLWKE